MSIIGYKVFLPNAEIGGKSHQRSSVAIHLVDWWYSGGTGQSIALHNEKKLWSVCVVFAAV